MPPATTSDSGDGEARRMGESGATGNRIGQYVSTWVVPRTSTVPGERGKSGEVGEWQCEVRWGARRMVARREQGAVGNVSRGEWGTFKGETSSQIQTQDVPRAPRV